MGSRIKDRLTYANVLATIAMFGVVAGGGAVAATSGDGRTTAAGEPIATAGASTKKQLKKLKKRVKALEALVAAIPPGGEAPGQVAYFNSPTCPSGWSELTAARGRYLVGLNSGGVLGAAVGNDLSDQQNRAVGQHNHGVSDPGHTHSVTIGASNDDASEGLATGLVDTANNPQDLSVVPESSDETTGITINNAGGTSGTNAPYLQLLACQKG